LTAKYLSGQILSPLLAFWLVVTPALADNKPKPLKKRDNPQLIGNRDINKGQINFYSLEKELALGRRMAAEMDRRSKLVAEQGSQQPLTFAAMKTAMQTDQLTFRSVDGKRVSLADHKGHIVVLVFNGTWIPMTNKSLPALQRIADLYENRGVVFYWVSINSAHIGDESYISDANLKAFARENDLQLTVLRDSERKAFRAFGLDALPSIVIIDRKGEVYQKHAGFDPTRVLGYRVLSRALNQLVSTQF
jgi:peroxiredoxin